MLTYFFSQHFPIPTFSEFSSDPSRKTSWWFHGTTAKSVSDILHAIDLHKGQPRRDFDVGPSFYLNPNFDDCFQWCVIKAEKEFTAHVAIIAYHIDDPSLHSKQPHLIFGQADENWRQLVSCSRRGDGAGRHQFLEAMNALHVNWIRGPQCSNPDQVVHRENPRTTGHQQLALCSQTTVNLFAHCPCVVFFQPSLVSTRMQRSLTPEAFLTWNHRRQRNDRNLFDTMDADEIDPLPPSPPPPLSAQPVKTSDAWDEDFLPVRSF